jgi:hypothetical protein
MYNRDALNAKIDTTAYVKKTNHDRLKAQPNKKGEIQWKHRQK